MYQGNKEKISIQRHQRFDTSKEGALARNLHASPKGCKYIKMEQLIKTILENKPSGIYEFCMVADDNV